MAENHSVQIKTVLRGSAAEQAGFAAGDEWLGLRVKTRLGASAKPRRCGVLRRPQTKLVAVVARDGRLLELPPTLPAAVPPGSAAQGSRAASRSRDTVNLTATTAAASRWLAALRDSKVPLDIQWLPCWWNQPHFKTQTRRQHGLRNH